MSLPLIQSSQRLSLWNMKEYTCGGTYIPCIYLPLLSMKGCTSVGVYVPSSVEHKRMYLCWSLCTLYLPSSAEHERMYLWWSLCTLYLPSSAEHERMYRSLLEFMYFVFTRMPGESYRRQLRSLLCLRDVFRTLINSLVCRLNMKVFLIHILGTLLAAKNFVFLTFVFLVH